MSIDYFTEQRERFHRRIDERRALYVQSQHMLTAQSSHQQRKQSEEDGGVADHPIIIRVSDLLQRGRWEDLYDYLLCEGEGGDGGGGGGEGPALTPSSTSTPPSAAATSDATNALNDAAPLPLPLSSAASIDEASLTTVLSTIAATYPTGSPSNVLSSPFVTEATAAGLTTFLFTQDPRNSLTRRCLLSAACWPRTRPIHVALCQLLLCKYKACPNGNAAIIGLAAAAAAPASSSPLVMTANVIIGGDDVPAAGSDGSEEEGDDDDGGGDVEGEEEDVDPSAAFSLFGDLEEPSEKKKRRKTLQRDAERLKANATAAAVGTTNTLSFPLAFCGVAPTAAAAYAATTPLHTLFTMELSHQGQGVVPLSSLLWDLLVTEHNAHVDPFDPHPRSTRQTPLITMIQAASSNSGGGGQQQGGGGNGAAEALLFGLSADILRRMGRGGHTAGGGGGGGEGLMGSPTHSSSVPAMSRQPTGFDPTDWGSASTSNHGVAHPSSSFSSSSYPNHDDTDRPSSASSSSIVDRNGFIRWSSFTSAKAAHPSVGMMGTAANGSHRVVQRYHCLLAVGASVNSYTAPSVDDPDADEGLKFRTSALVSKNPLAQCIYISNHRLTDLRPAYIRSIHANAVEQQQQQQQQNNTISTANAANNNLFNVGSRRHRHNDDHYGDGGDDERGGDHQQNPLQQQQHKRLIGIAQLLSGATDGGGADDGANAPNGRGRLAGAGGIVNLDQLDHPLDDYDRAAAAKALLDCGADISSVQLLCGSHACEKVTSDALRQLLLAEGVFNC